MSNRRIVVAACMLIFMAFPGFTGTSVEAASPWYYSVTGPGGSNEIPADKTGQILYFQFDATTADYVWGNVRIDFDPTLLECVSIEETPDPNGFWTAWVTQTANPAYGGGGALYYYDSTGLGSDWAQYWVSQYGPLNAGPSGSYDNALGIIRLYVMTNAGGRNGSVPLRIGFRVKQAGTAVFDTYANDWTAFGWPTAPLWSLSAESTVQAASAGQGFSWNLADLPFRNTSVVKIVPQTCVQPPSGMIGWWPGDGNANDIAGGNHGSIVGGMSYAVGEVGQSFNFVGNNYVSIPNNPSLEPAQFTVGGWIKPQFDGRPLEADAVDTIIEKYSNNGGYGLFVAMDPYGGSGFSPPAPISMGVPIFLLTVNGNQHQIFGSAPVPNDNSYHYVSATYDGTTMRIYIDGVEVENHSLPGIITHSGSDASIGYEAVWPRWSRATIDEVNMYSRALSIDEIRAIYLAGSAGMCKPANRPPAANAGFDQAKEMTSCAGASVILDGLASSDPDGDALTYTWTENGVIIATGVNPAVTLSSGSHTITLTVDDGKGGSATDEVVINVVDTTAPVLNVTLSPNALWPPNHKYVKVAPSITVNDACVETTTVTLVSTTSSEPDNGLGDGDTANDIVVNSDGTISLRAERSGTGSGRVYTITYRATDIAGNTATASATASVPHNK